MEKEITHLWGGWNAEANYDGCLCDLQNNLCRCCRKQVVSIIVLHATPDSKVHGANMGPTWVLSAPDGPHMGLLNLAIRDYSR